jgi:nucleotide-binding universal stress UspA family protein
MYDVLLAIDDDTSRAEAEATAVADMPVRTDDTKITIIHDFEDNPEGASVSQVRSVRRAESILEEAGLEVVLAESSGEPAQRILSTADDIDADLIVLAGRKRTPAGKVLFGSVTQAVILGTDRPVMVCSGEQ